MSSARIGLAHRVIAAGAKLQTFAVLVLRPDDLIEFSRQTYARPGTVADWARPGLVDEGLYPNEQALLEHCPVREGRLLLLGVGGGREAIPFARAGYAVTGVDFVPGMVAKAQANAAAAGLQIAGLVQELSRLDVPAGSFDLVWISSRMYSCVPTRARRVAALQRIRRALRPGGCLVCMFEWNPRKRLTWRGLLLRKAIALLTLGHVAFEAGDQLMHNIEFIHSFTDEEALREEFAAGGYAVLHLDLPKAGYGGAVLQTAAEIGPSAEGA
ncbi:MAG: class I SAM-dependent methyltransferase [Chloroflexi bacterium]|nr:class I SAM-dependent methyltransferase [Chloroflexota bacterium]